MIVQDARLSVGGTPAVPQAAAELGRVVAEGAVGERHRRRTVVHAAAAIAAGGVAADRAAGERPSSRCPS